MNHNDPTLHSTLTWIAAHGNASKELRRDAKATQAHVDDATALHAQIVNDNRTNLVRLRQTEQAALQELCDKPTRDNVRTVVDLRQLYDDTQARQLREVIAAEHAAGVAWNATAQLFRQHNDELLQLVAVERCTDFGKDDALSPAARDVWRRLDYQWHPSLDELLQLNPGFRGQSYCPQRKHLPLTWSAKEPAALRKALQWCWQQIAEGHVRRVNVPLTRQQRDNGVQPGSKGTCLRLTADTDTAPGKR